jgi:hypothetical protein
LIFHFPPRRRHFILRPNLLSMPLFRHCSIHYFISVDATRCAYYDAACHRHPTLPLMIFRHYFRLLIPFMLSAITPLRFLYYCHCPPFLHATIILPAAIFIISMPRHYAISLLSICLQMRAKNTMRKPKISPRYAMPPARSFLILLMLLRLSVPPLPCHFDFACRRSFVAKTPRLRDRRCAVKMWHVRDRWHSEVHAVSGKHTYSPSATTARYAISPVRRPRWRCACRLPHTRSQFVHATIDDDV